jgi:hypothetical protein
LDPRVRQGHKGRLVSKGHRALLDRWELLAQRAPKVRPDPRAQPVRLALPDGRAPRGSRVRPATSGPAELRGHRVIPVLPAQRDQRGLWGHPDRPVPKAARAT